MDDDRKVTELVEQSKLVFLREAVEEFRRKQRTYDLETEFAKTRRNRTAVVPGVILAILLVFSISAMAVNFYIEQAAATVELDFDQFEDINLREVLDSWLQVERSIEELETSIDALSEERDSRIRLAERTGERRVALLEVTDMDPATRDEEISNVESETEEQVAAIANDYNQRIEELQNELADLQQRQEEEFDEQEVEAALARREQLEERGRLQRLELEEQQEFFVERLSQLRESYEDELQSHDEHSEELRATLIEQYESEIAQLEEEHAEEIEELILRYNPDMSDEDIAELLEASLPEVPSGRSYREVLSRTGAISEADYRDLQQMVSELEQIIGRLKEIPYENSVPAALEQLEARAGAVAGEYDRVWDRLADSYEGLEAEFAEREQELEDELARTRREAEEELAQTEAEFEQELDQRTGELESFEYAFGELIVEDRESGFVVDARDPSEIHIVLDRIRDVEEGTEGVIFRDPEGYVADISFYERDGRILARAGDIAEGRTIRPFDRILIQVGGIGGLDDLQVPAEEEMLPQEDPPALDGQLEEEDDEQAE